jgi:hypothetical protein
MMAFSEIPSHSSPMRSSLVASWLSKFASGLTVKKYHDKQADMAINPIIKIDLFKENRFL